MIILLLLAVPGEIGDYYLRRLRAGFPQAKIDLVRHHSQVDPYIGAADVLVTFGPLMAEHVLQKAAALKWIQALGTGVDNICDRPSLKKEILVTHLHGVHGDAMSESAIMLMLALSRDLPRSVKNQATHAWERFPPRLLSRKTAGILGVGAIAEVLAPRLKALDMRVVGISSATRTLPGFDRIAHKSDLAQAVRDLDYLVILTPYSPQTRNMVDGRILAAMKPTAFLVNLARGGVVDEAALIEALNEKRLAGAALDVFATEPLSADHPFWDMPNVIVTPHLGGFHDEYADRALPVIEENLRRFISGDTRNMINLVEH